MNKTTKIYCPNKAYMILFFVKSNILLKDIIKVPNSSFEVRASGSSSLVSLFLVISKKLEDIILMSFDKDLAKSVNKN